MARKTKPEAGKSVEALRHQEAKRQSIPTAEYQSVIQKEAGEEDAPDVPGRPAPGDGQPGRARGPAQQVPAIR
jgi:hypothetical protein